MIDIKKLQGYNLIFSEIDAQYHIIAERLGLSDSVSKILYTFICLDDKCALKDLGYYTGLSKQTLNSAMQKLVKEGYFELKNIDKKSKVVVITDKGKVLAENTAGNIFAMENEIFSTWSKEEVDMYMSLSKRFLQSVKNMVNNDKAK